MFDLKSPINVGTKPVFHIQGGGYRKMTVYTTEIQPINHIIFYDISC